MHQGDYEIHLLYYVVTQEDSGPIQLMTCILRRPNRTQIAKAVLVALPTSFRVSPSLFG